MAWAMKDQTAIVGIGQTEFARWGKIERSEFQLGLEACVAACNDAGVNVKDVDGFVTYSSDRNHPMRMAQALGVKQARFCNYYPGGGESTAGVVHNAAMAIFSGTAEMVLCYRALSMGQFGRFGQSRLGATAPPAGGDSAFQSPFGSMSAPQFYALQARRHMHEFGTTSRQFGAISVAAYKHAQRNPRAVMHGRPLTIEDHQASRIIADPYHLYDCCLESDGACAVLVTSAERAKTLRHKPVYIMAASQGAPPSDQMYSYQRHMGRFNTAGFTDIARDLFNRAGIATKDIDVAQFYETFTGQVIMAIEDFGFAPRGEGGPWVEGGRIEWPDGELPINTSGGNLAEAYIHGFAMMLEGVRQMRGDSTSQVDGAEIGLVVGGPSALPSSALILRR